MLVGSSQRAIWSRDSSSFDELHSAREYQHPACAGSRCRSQLKTKLFLGDNGHGLSLTELGAVGFWLPVADYGGFQRDRLLPPFGECHGEADDVSKHA